MSIAVIVVDGVMRKLVGGSPIPEGIRLYQSLVLTGQVILLSHDGTPQTSDWLELNGCTRHRFIRITPLHSWASMANDLRRDGYDIDLVVVPDPQSAVELILAGLNTLLFTHAMYTRPDWRPDTSKGITPWAEIVATHALTARLKAADERLKAND